MPKILKVAIPIPLRSTFDYLLPDECKFTELHPGIRLAVPFGGQQKIGYLIEITNHSSVPLSRLKPVNKILDEKPLLSTTDLKFLLWASRYYHHPIGEVISSAFPILLRKGRPAVLKSKKILFLTKKGSEIPISDLKRAWRQTELTELLRSSPQGITWKELNKLGKNWQSSAKRLVEKGLVEIQQSPTLLNYNRNTKIAPFTLNQAQRNAIDRVRNASGQFKTFLLEGVTGSGKTEVYLRLTEFATKQNKQVMVLMPEISLTPQLEARFRERLGHPIAVFHSGLTQSERQQAWCCFQRGLAPILLGTRSAVFTPMLNPGLIILDEEHDTSFKQQDGFRFSARDIAIARAKQLCIPILLGSATPSLESLFNTKQRRYQLLHLPERAGKARPPVLKLLDIRNQYLTEGLSATLLSEIKGTLARRQQVLLFLNRRGFAPILICHHCGWVASCIRCDSHLVMHVAEGTLRCHHCGHKKELLKHCDVCQAKDLRPLGLGTERIEKALKNLFPAVKVARIDRDSTKIKGSLETFLQQITAGDLDILIGTQMLAKGHHFPGVTLVGILDVDAGLFSTDFRASERMAQVIVQVAGRAGREQIPGTVILQTRHPQQPLLLSLIDKGYRGFATNALVERKTARLPPYSYQALLRAETMDKQKPEQFLEKVRILASNCAIKEIVILGPVTAPLAKKAGCYRFQLLFQSAKREQLHILLESILPQISKLPDSKKVKWSLDIDPVDLY